MSTFIGSEQATVDLIAKGLRAQFEEALRKEFMAIATPIVEQAAKEAAERVVLALEKVNRIDKHSVELHVTFNDKKL